jgi:hypothetical protein
MVGASRKRCNNSGTAKADVLSAAYSGGCSAIDCTNSRSSGLMATTRQARHRQGAHDPPGGEDQLDLSVAVPDFPGPILLVMEPRALNASNLEQAVTPRLGHACMLPSPSTGRRLPWTSLLPSSSQKLMPSTTT